MFHWICPECGGEIPPTVRECPICDPSAAPVELTPAASVKSTPTPVSAAVLTVEVPRVAVSKIPGLKVKDAARRDAPVIPPVLEAAPRAVDDSGLGARVEQPDDPIVADGTPAVGDAPPAGLEASPDAPANATELSATGTGPVAIDKGQGPGIGEVQAGPVQASEELAPTARNGSTQPDAAIKEQEPGIEKGHADALQASEELAHTARNGSTQLDASVKGQEPDAVQASGEPPFPAPKEPEVPVASSVQEASADPLTALGEHLRVMKELTAAIAESVEPTPAETASKEPAPELEPTPTTEAEQSGESERRGASPLEPGDLLELAAVVGMREADDPEESEEAISAGAESDPAPTATAGVEVVPETPAPASPVQKDSEEPTAERQLDTPPFSPAIDLQRTIATLRTAVALPSPPQYPLLAPLPIAPTQAISLPPAPVLLVDPSVEAKTGRTSEPKIEAPVVAAAPAENLPALDEHTAKAAVQDESVAAKASVPEQLLVADPLASAAGTTEAPEDHELEVAAPTEDLTPEAEPLRVDADAETVAGALLTEEPVATVEERNSAEGPAVEKALSPTDRVEPASMDESAASSSPAAETVTQAAAEGVEVVEPAAEERVADSQSSDEPQVDTQVSPADVAPVEVPPLEAIPVGITASHIATSDLVSAEAQTSEIRAKAESRIAEQSLSEQPISEQPRGAESSVIAASAASEAAPERNAEADPAEEFPTAEYPAVEEVTQFSDESSETSFETSSDRERADERMLDSGEADESLLPSELQEHVPLAAEPTDSSHAAAEVAEPVSVEPQEQEKLIEVVDEPQLATSVAASAPAETSPPANDPEVTSLPLPETDSTSVASISSASGQRPEAGNQSTPEPEAEVPEISSMGPSLPLAPLQDYRPATPTGMRPALPEVKILKPNASPSMTLPGPLLHPKLVTFQEGHIVSANGGKGRSKSAIPGWVVSGLVAIVLLGAGAVAVLPSLPHSNADAKAPSTESPAPAAQDASYPLSKSVEVTGFRIVVDFNKKSEIHYLVVNHSSANLTGVNIFVTLQSGNAKAGQPPVCRFSFLAPDLGPFESKEMISSIEKLNRSVNLPDWQDLRADVQVAP